MVEHLKVLISRAPKGDGGQSSMLTHPLMAAMAAMAALTVEREIPHHMNSE